MRDAITLIGGKVEKADELPPETLHGMAAARERQQLRHLAAAHQWKRLDEREVERVGKRGRYYSDANGLLYDSIALDPNAGIYPAGKGPTDVNAYIETPRGFVLLVRRSAAPRTRAEVDAEKQAWREKAAESALERERKATSAPLRAVTLADLEGVPLPTVRRAAEIIEKAHGLVSSEKGRVTISFHGGKIPGGCRTPARVLFSEPELVADALRRRKDGEHLSALLPDEQARP